MYVDVFVTTVAALFNQSVYVGQWNFSKPIFYEVE